MSNTTPNNHYPCETTSETTNCNLIDPKEPSDNGSRRFARHASDDDDEEEEASHSSSSCAPTEEQRQNEHAKLVQAIRQGDVMYILAWLHHERTQWNGLALILPPHCSFATNDDDGDDDDHCNTSWLGYGMVRQMMQHSSQSDKMIHQIEVSLLHVAIEEDQVEIVEALLAHGANLEFYSMGCRQELQTPLAFACASNANACIIQRLLEAGADPTVGSCCNDNQQTIWMLCAMDNLVDVAQVLIQSDAACQILNAQDQDGQTALFLATMCQSLDMQKCLLGQGVDTNIVANSGRTALHEEVSGQEPSAEIVRLLLSNGAHVNARTQSGATPLMLILRAGEGFLDIVRMLLQAGALVNVEDNYGGTPLQCAQNEAQIHVLLTWGNVDINHTNSRGETALHIAAQERYSGSRVAMLLQEFGAMPGLRDSVHGRTPLHYAARSGNDQAFLALLMSQVHLMARCTIFGRTPLHELVWAGGATRGPHPWLLEKYLRAAESWHQVETLVNASDNRGWTPLHWAAFRGDADAVRLLVDKGASVRAVDARGRTPLHLACLTFINAREWKEGMDIAHQVLTADHPMSQEDWDRLRTTDYGVHHLSSFRGCGPPGGWFVTCDVAKILLHDFQANPSTMDNDGNLPLFMAALLMEGHPELSDTVFLNIRAGAHVRLSM